MGRDRGEQAAIHRARGRVIDDGSPADLVVVGAGILGLATARAFLLSHPGASVVVLDKEQRIAAHQSGRNSGVIHAGIYYRPGSEKAALCREGRVLLLDYCRERDIPHEVCGKVVVATSTTEAGRLAALHARARENGIAVTLLDRRGLAAIEPHADGIAALHVPDTGVVDFGAVCASYAADIRAAGGQISLGVAVRSLRVGGRLAMVDTGGDTIRARAAVNCAGLHSDTLAASSDARIVPFRGEFFTLAPSRSFLVRRLIYPVPDPRFPFLGVHFTRGIDGSVHAGPNAVLALGREAYSWGDTDARAAMSMAGDRRLWQLARRYWRTGAGELARSVSMTRFVAALRRLVPEVAAADLTPAPAGIRAQLVRPSGELVDDFAFSFDAPIVHVLNAPSPAATASLAIGARIAREIESRRRATVG